MKFVALFLVVAGALFSSITRAEIVTVGALTRDTTSTTIVDSLNNRIWLGWDVTKGLTYDLIVAASGAGGQFEGYQFARNSDAQMYVEAMLGSVGCNTSNNAYCAIYENNDVERVSGESAFNSMLGNDVDVVFFLSDDGIGSPVGSMFHVTYLDPLQGLDYFVKFNDGGYQTIAEADIRAVGSPTDQIGWLLYRTTNTVSEPSSFALIGLALCVVAAARRKRSTPFGTDEEV